MLQLRWPAAAAIALAAAASLRAGPWPEVQSDLPPDPLVRWGVLANGLRYAIRHNDEPRGRASLRLLVGAGSIDERPSERGIAHFIEHMAYRGTREHPDGSFTEELQRLGVGFGPDTAAFTFWDHTLYLLELPDTREATLREGLGVFREYAQDILFEPALIDRERDVILNELDMRDTPEARSGDANMNLLWPGSRQALRKPIGLAENIRDFTRDQFTDFYNAWYRPERMVVVVVGDIDPAAVERLVASEMAGVRGRGQARDDDIQLVPAEAANPDIRVFEDPGLAGADCQFEHPFREAAAPDTHALRVAQLRRALALAVLQRRAARFSKASGGKFIVPVARVTNPVPGWALVSFGANGNIDNWNALVGDLEREHRRAFLYGFTEPELAVARAAFATGYEDAVRTSATWHSDWLASEIADSVVRGRVFSTPAALQKDMAPEIEAATPAECLKEYRRAWTGASMHVFVSTNPAFRVKASELAAALNASRATEVAREAEAAAPAFAYTSFGPAGSIARSAEIKDLDIRQAEFANGVRLNFKATAFDAGSVDVYVRVGTGRLSQPQSEPGLDLLANAIIPYGGLGKHSVEDLQDIMASHSMAMNFGVDSDSLFFSARCAPKDLGICLQLVAAYLTDTAYRADALPVARASVETMYTSMASSAAGPITMHSTRVLSGGDLRFGAATHAEFDKRTVAEVRDWVGPQFKSGPIEASVVGEASWEDVAEKVGATLGALPRRSERAAGEASQALHPPQKPSKADYVYTTSPNLRQVAITEFCQVPDLDGIHTERRCTLLSALLAERMRVRLRVDLGAAYDFSSDFVVYDGFPDFSFFYASTTVAPEHAKRAVELIQSEIEALRRGRFSDDEFERVKVPLLRKRDADLRDNSYWIATVLKDCQQRPDRLTAARDRQADNTSITRGDVEALAKRYFAKDRWFLFVAYPHASSQYNQAVRPFDGRTKFESGNLVPAKGP